jgi:hypothetical protein
MCSKLGHSGLGERRPTAAPKILPNSAAKWIQKIMENGEQ